MSKYMTRQRKALLGFLGAHTDEPLSAREIADALAPESVSLSAVYRNLAELEREGVLRRGGVNGSRESTFQYIGAAACRDCLHLSCTRCGRTFHLSIAGAERLQRDALRSDEFCIDRGETVLYGVCRECRK